MSCALGQVSITFKAITILRVSSFLILSQVNLTAVATAVLLLVLDDLESAKLSAEKLSLHRLRDSMGPGLDPVLGYLRCVMACYIAGYRLKEMLNAQNTKELARCRRSCFILHCRAVRLSRLSVLDYANRASIESAHYPTSLYPGF